MISFLVAMDEQRLIGSDNGMPWHLPADLAYFKKTTMNHPIIMGRKTHESIGRALPGRQNIVITRQTNYHAEGCDLVHSFAEAQSLLPKDTEAFVIGGAQLFSTCYEQADRLYITLIHDTFAGDTYFPDMADRSWTLISQEQGGRNEKNPYDYEFLVYEKIKQSSQPDNCES